ncbi:hypothetical protein [Anaerocolumna chitinilytica]|uniref:Colicin D immunity protein domain-containing protein n=1 Tax=Anaerocolumna chitinilytica TaxID=1727145 RepID=A0A7I8DR51_9FIRM|nr:hypothetical protein [Anaerocolumna chitinilytica]BCK00753.1 hypothetical protein bsdcttw_37930 [Anaerocolumna chitinilytica]
MDIRDQLYYLIREYKKGNYITKTFCEEFTVIYCNERYRAGLNDIEEIVFDGLNDVTSRYSEFEEDLNMYPKVYKSECDVRNAVEKVYSELNMGSKH